MKASSQGRRVLMLARHFPPIGGAGVHRSVGYARHLPRYGYWPAVVTGAGQTRDRWSPRDPALLAGLPSDAEIHRLPYPEPDHDTGMRARVNRWLLRRPPWIQAWVQGAVEEGRRVAGDAELILASCIPYETAEAGAMLSAELGIPWIADLEDPWALDEMFVQPTALHQRVAFARMRRSLATASAIVTCAPEAASRFREALPEFEGKLIEAVPIGFEPESFAESGPGFPKDALSIVHTGSLHTELGQVHRRNRRVRRLLGGTSVDVDILTRSVVFLLEALRQVRHSDPELAERIELHLAGDMTEADRAVAEGHPCVRIHGQLSHQQTVELMLSAELLFLPMHDLPVGERAGLIPYKTYEYLAARRPILAAVPDGDVRDMLEPLPYAIVCRPSDINGMAHAIRARLADGHTGDLGLDLAVPPLSDYDRGRLVGRIAQLFDHVLAPTAVPSTLRRSRGSRVLH
jgi:glycosyltransferase involved in cell wall biosynthesis